MKRIQKMSPHLSNKIAAGEVIESPASVIKELVENSIDANSTQIQVEIEGGGRRSLKISDNGDGIHPDDIPLIFERHATSKLLKDEDLSHIASLGFRGEALASIAAVSKVQLLSRVMALPTGFKIQLLRGETFHQETIAANPGTTLIIEDLFYNLPGRKKFLKSEKSLNRDIHEVMNHFALSHPDIQFNYVNEGRLIFNTPGGNDLPGVIYTLYGRELFEHLLAFETQIGDVQITGYASDLGYYRGNRSLQYLFVNRRYVENRILLDSLNEAYRALIPGHKFPVFFLYLSVDPGVVDVNVHPSKLVVKIEGEEGIGLELSGTFREELYRKESHSRGVIAKEPTPPANAPREISTETIQPPLYDQLSLKETRGVKERQEIQTLSRHILDRNQEAARDKYQVFRNLNYVGQVLGTYLIFEKERAVFFIDQHAAHEKILYEGFMKRYATDSLDSQGLVTPEILGLSHEEIRLIENRMQDFSRFGYDLEIFGPSDLLVRGIPSLFTLDQAKTLLVELLDNYRQEDYRYEKLTEEAIIQHSCKKAIKGNSRIEPLEVEKLLEDLMTLEDPLTCPHGRPLIVELSSRELEKIFYRIQR
ncbi:MAG: hypothetical protein AVO33_10675 [delta proteobacterium ML8_F1]|nr:MAG: hypothetical protein AVO33_10675 [delta proteobacterium ML8_F1]